MLVDLVIRFCLLRAVLTRVQRGQPSTRSTSRRMARIYSGVVIGAVLLGMAWEAARGGSASDPFGTGFVASVMGGLGANVTGPAVGRRLLARHADVLSRRPPATAAGIAALRVDSPDDAGLLLAEINAHYRENNHRFAFAPLREALHHPQVIGTQRGHAAALLGWGLLYSYADDPVPDEARTCADVAQSLAPEYEMTQMLRAFLLVEDGDASAAVAVARRRCGQLQDGLLQAQILCVEAAGLHQLGDSAGAADARERAVSLWAECDLLPWLDERGSARRQPGG